MFNDLRCAGAFSTATPQHMVVGRVVVRARVKVKVKAM
jgi:hypothetical protein